MAIAIIYSSPMTATLESLVQTVQVAYPQIWFACHSKHRGRADGDGLTDHEAGLLLHVVATPDRTPSELSAHLGIGRPALSAQLKRLVAAGLIELAAGEDARTRKVRASSSGAELALARSPLDGTRVRQLLERLSEAERASAVAGLLLLAQAATRGASA